MCTAVSFVSSAHYFGRNLDLDCSYHEQVVICPRNYLFPMRHVSDLESHYAMIGMAAVVEGMPLFYEAGNEKGLCMAGLNFPSNAKYKKYEDGKDNVAPFELIVWILGQCSTLGDAKRLLNRINLIHTDFSNQMHVSPLHWMISDKTGSIVVECVEDGLKVYDNPWGILTNNPTFDYHLTNMHQYMNLYEGSAVNTLDSTVKLNNFSLGFGALGLPGDYSSPSRFVRAAYVKSKSVRSNYENESVNQFFHILNSVSMPKGCVMCPNGKYEYTRYSCCITESGKYYYTTYHNSTKTCIDLYSADLNADQIVIFELNEESTQLS